MIVQCCVCKKVRCHERWIHRAVSLQERREVSHGYCNHCAEAAFREIREQHGRKRMYERAVVNL